jgi:hypothetical protein
MRSPSNVVAEVEPDAEFQPPLGRDVGVASMEHALDLDRAASCIERARELGEEVVARGIDHTTAMLANEDRDVLASGLQRPDRRHLVASHKAAVASHVSAPDSGELAFDDARIHGASSRPTRESVERGLDPRVVEPWEVTCAPPSRRFAGSGIRRDTARV